MNNLPLQPLKWQRIDTAKLSGIYCQKTDSYIEDAVSFCSTLVADYVIRKDKETGKYSANYGGRHENTYDTIEDAEHWAEHTHYASQMQPYVKPSPTWFNYETEKPTQGDSIVIAWVWMGDKHTIWLESYSPAEIDYLDDCLDVYWSFSPFKSEVTK